MRVSPRAAADTGLLVLVNAMWAAQYPAYKTATAQIGPVTLSVWTFLISSVVLAPFLLRERRVAAKTHSRGSLSVGTAWRNFLLLAFLGLVPASVLLAWGTVLSTASNAALLYLTVPILTALLAIVIVGEKMNPVRWASLALSLAGVLIISGFDWRHADFRSARFFAGNLLVLVACAASAFYNVYSKKLLRRFTPLEVLVFGYLLTAALCLPLAPWIEPFSLASMRAYTAGTWAAVLVLSVFSWGLAMVLWMYLLKRLDVSQASVSIYLLPFLGVLLSAITLNEKITTTMMVGGLVTLAGTILITSVESTASAEPLESSS
jgi:drug/metabolite transporter (DMT)-like permease